MVGDVLVALEVLCDIDSIAVVLFFDDFWIRGQNSFCLGQKRGSDSQVSCRETVSQSMESQLMRIVALCVCAACALCSALCSLSSCYCGGVSGVNYC